MQEEPAGFALVTDVPLGTEVVSFTAGKAGDVTIATNRKRGAFSAGSAGASKRGAGLSRGETQGSWWEVGAEPQAFQGDFLGARGSAPASVPHRPVCSRASLGVRAGLGWGPGQTPICSRLARLGPPRFAPQRGPGRAQGPELREAAPIAGLSSRGAFWK